jgi:hypothetical protein
MTRVRPSEVARLALVALFVLLGPTPGDIGSCNEAPDDLDSNKFFENKQEVDCQRCTQCSIVTQTCLKACTPPALGGTFPVGCYPLVHDGEVCLDALLAASCSAVASYVADEGATIPTECNFCPPQDGGAE